MDVAAHAIVQEARLGSSGRVTRDDAPRVDAALPITLGPERAVAHRGWTQARDDLLVAALVNPGVILLLGPPGTGKSLLLQDLAQSRRATGSEVLYQARGDLPVEVTEQRAVGRRRFVLIDEADRMDGPALDRLRDLGRCTLVLAGLAGPKRGEAAAFPDAAIVQLSPVPADEVCSFIAARLAQGGWPEDLFTDQAVARLAALSAGVPRSLNILVSSALYLAGNEASGFVEASHVEQAASLRAGDPDVAVAGLPEPSLGNGGPSDNLPPNEGDRPAYLRAVPLMSRVVRPRVKRRVLPMAGAACAVAVTVAMLAVGLNHGLWPDFAPALPPIVAEVVADRSPLEPPATPDAMAAPTPTPVAERAAPTSVPELPARATPEAVLPEPTGIVTEQPAAVFIPVPPSPPPFVPSPLPLISEPMRPVATVEAPPPALPAVAKSAPVALPFAAPARVTLRYGRGNADNVEKAASLAASLRQAGFLVDGQVADLPRDAPAGVRYFYAEDRAAADTVLKAAGDPGTSLLWRGLEQANPPRPGRVEIWMRPG